MQTLEAYCADTPVVVHFLVEATPPQIRVARVLAADNRPLALTEDMLVAFQQLIEEIFQ